MTSMIDSVGKFVETRLYFGNAVAAYMLASLAGARTPGVQTRNKSESLRQSNTGACYMRSLLG